MEMNAFLSSPDSPIASQRPEFAAVHRARGLMAQISTLLDNFAVAEPAQPSISPLAKALRLQKERTIREAYFPSHLTKDPVWPMLLELYRSRIEGKTISVTALSFGVGIPPATGHRWINGLCKEGFAEIRQSSTDKRCCIISMTDKGHRSMSDYLQRIE